ncbi:MAG: phosphohistidine phosphatase SixA [Acidobacteria bacterium]|nr:phosphohistidine phosphatase SixA [Acidobacteriota bacterium]
MRHGIATDRSGRYASNDANRPLTPMGRKRTEQIAAGLKSLGYEFDWIVTSPLVRARETAEIVASSTRDNTPLDECPALRPGGSFEELLSFLDKNPRCRRVLLVGHEPDLSTLASRLIGAGPVANLIFKKGGCCLIQCDGRPSQSAGRLVWWLTPRLLRAFR